MNSENKGRNTNVSNRLKLWIVFLVFLLVFFVFALRLIQYQVIDKDIIQEQAESQLTRKIPYKAMRGQILDRNGSVLAFSRDTYDIEIVHELGEVRQDLIDKIAKVYPSVDPVQMADKMRTTDQIYVRVLEDLPIEIAETIGEVDPVNIGVIRRFKRIYPNGELAANILGTISMDGDGVSGIEQRFNDSLKGKDGFIETKTDLLGRRNPYSEVTEKQPLQGENVVLTIDAAIQHFAQTIVKEERISLGAKEVMAIIQDSKSGEILAMASSYSFDPNNPQVINDEALQLQYDQSETDEERSAILLKMWDNPFVSTFYEPGSTFKILVSLMALEENMVSSDVSFNCGGQISVDGEPVRCVTYPGSHGALTFKQGFMYSCNVVFAEVVSMLGKDNYYKYLDNMHLLTKMDIGLPMPYDPVFIKKEDLYDIDFAKMSFGHSLSVTPLHVANIAHAVSNDGNVKLPTIIKSVGGEEWHTKNLGQVFSKATVSTVREYMEAAADNIPESLGVPGYRVGSKTGTSEKFIDGEYNSDFLTTSVVQISPIDDPKINVIVIVDEPKASKSSAETAGKVAGRITAECLRYLKIAPVGESEAEFINVPDFVGLTKSEAMLEAENFGIKISFDERLLTDANEDDWMLEVSSQKPGAGSLIAKDQEVILALKNIE